VDAETGTAAPLPTRGDSIAPTMLDGTSGGLAFSSSLSGSVRAIGPDGAVLYNVSGLQRPLGLRLMPGGIALVAEQATGRILRVGPSAESRGRLMADGLAGPVGLVVADATRGYVTEELGGRVTMFRLDRFEKATVASGLDHPEGIALLPDGRLAVAEVGKRRLLAVDRETGAIEVMVDNLPVGLPSPLGAGDPYTVTDVATAPGGAIFVSADVDRTVLRLTPRAAAPQEQAP
jgi:sugar lactone lactonase YvrE